MGEEHIISKEGYEKLKNELDMLVDVKRKEIADRIQKAKDMGDLSENAEYSEAKDAQAFNEGRIAELKNTLKNVHIVEKDEGGKVGMGSVVITKINGNEKRFEIVSFNEADPLSGKISNESPLGRSLIGKDSGAKIIVQTPKGMIEYEILRVE